MMGAFGMNSPEISVVMSVYNGASHLSTSIESILSQQGVDLEFIIVNDGSTDETSNILASYATHDSRVRIIEQENAGLTQALIRGCSEARGTFIARQDVGDISIPGRLHKQHSFALNHPEAILISCGTRFVGPKGELLFESIQHPDEATNCLTTLDINKLRSPSHHGCTLFRKQIYDFVGGYRPEFFMAQDMDLWVRMAEIGMHLPLADILYQAEYSFGGISSGHWNLQKKIGRKILLSARSRREGLDDSSILASIYELKKHRRTTRFSNSRALYFIGMCLFDKDVISAKHYLLSALKENPYNLKVALRYLHACRRAK
jgi:glycosyltransferase involved in cell wall biosynthesis